MNCKNENDMKQMPPEWMMYPEIPFESIGWQIKYGKTYLDEYNKWKNSLTPQELSEHNKLFPMPQCWTTDDDNIMRNDDFLIYRWQQNGSVYTKDSISANDHNNYIFFWGHHGKEGVVNKSCMSQWFLSDFKIGSLQYNCMEQYMMSQKAKLFGDNDICEKIMKTVDQKEIKSLGREIKNFEETIWNKFKFQIVLTGNYYKFVQNENLRQFLINTGNAVLVEASPYDHIWGVGMSQDDALIQNPLQWKGENLLGFALMQVRDEINRVWKNFDLINWNSINKKYIR